ncbi:MAG: FtsX-like permease family protein [Candidatus Hermodarchaeota archaeon]
MGIITKVAFRNMKRRKTRYILTTITLIIGVSLFGGILINRDSFKVMFINDIDRRMGSADILLRNTEDPDGWFDPDDLDDEHIGRLAHVEDIAYRISGLDVFVSATSEGNQVDDSTRTAIYGMDPDSKAEENIGGNPTILESDSKGKTIEEILDDADDDEVIITESLQIKLGSHFEVGDSIRILPKDYYILVGEDEDVIASNTGLWPEYTVIAIIRDLGEARDFDPETPSDYDIPSQGPCLFVNIEQAHDLVDGVNNYDGLFNLAAVSIDDVNFVEDVIDDIEDNLDDDEWVAADLKSDMIQDINDSVEIMMTMFLMFALIALILSIILILNIFNIIKEEQEYETGMFQAIGASKSETFRMFLSQGVIMGVIGAILGTIGAYFMAYLILFITLESLRNIPGFIGETFAQTEMEIILLPQTLIATFAVGVVSCILASIYPSWKASRKPIIDCLNPLAQKTERERKHRKRKVVSALLGASLILWGSSLLYGGAAQYGPGGEEGTSDAAISFIAPTMVLLGTIWILALFVAPLTAGFIKLFGPYLKHTKLLTEKNVLRHRKRTVLTFSMIAITVSYLIAISVFMGSMRAGVHTTVTDVMGCDIRIFAANTPRDFRDNLIRQDGVEEAMGVSHQNARILDDDEWVGHTLLEKDYDEGVSVHILDTDIVKERMTATVIVEPEDMTLTKMMNKLDSKNKVIITEKEAEDFDLEVGDHFLVEFSLGLSYPSLTDMLYGNDDNAIEEAVVVELKVVAIVQKFQGFATGEIVGQDEDFYNIYVSWETYEDISKNSLPGGNTDIIFRKKTDSGISEFDNAFPDWFNFSKVQSTLYGISGIDYYTTRMEYLSPTYDLENMPFNYSNPAINLDTNVIGIRTNTSGDFVSDSYFGSHQLVNQSNAYDGNSIEELLNNKTGVCVVDQTYVNTMKAFNASFEGINSTISIFPQQFQPGYSYLPANPLYTNATASNGTVVVDNEAYMGTPLDTNYYTIISNKSSLELIIEFNMTYFMTHYLQPYNISLSSYVNSTIDMLNIEVLNHYTEEFDYLGSINGTKTFPSSFDLTFNQEVPPYTYINQSNYMLKLKITGQNATYNSDYELGIDFLNLSFHNSTYSLTAPETWPKFTIIGIIRDPLLYQTERYNWLAGFETGLDILEVENSVYINYEDARNLVYTQYNGTATNGSYDEITTIYIHCNNVESIENVRDSLREDLPSGEGESWSVADTKSKTYEIRNYAFDWYIWIEAGRDDEKILEDLTAYFEDKGYIVLFSFTNSFITAIFESFIDLITLIMDGILIFAIVISMIGLALHCLLTTMARRREIGMLRSIGLNKKGVVRTVSGETLVVALLGSLIGIVTGLITGVMMVTSVPDTEFLTVTLTIPWLTILILVAVTLITAIISSRYPSKWAANINIIDAVRTR